MPEDYTTAMLMHDVMMTVQDNAPPIILVALFIGVVNFILGWFMYSLSVLAKAGKQ